MKKQVEYEDLLADVLADDNQCRSITLEYGLAALRRTRARRQIARLTLCLAAPLVVLAALLLVRNHPPAIRAVSEARTPSTQATKTIEGTSIRILSDEELLDLFKGRPVALVGQPGHQRLLLLDEGKN